MNRHRHTFAMGWAAALLLAVAFCALGGWQWRRMHEKEAMLASVARVIEAKRAAPLAAAADPARTKDYDWAEGRGRFLARPAWLLDNQQRAGRTGVRVFRLFQAEGMAMPLLVELGWLPLPASRALPAIAPPPSGRQVLRGLLLPPPSPGVIAAKAQVTPAGERLAIALKPAAIAAELGLPAIAPRVLRLDPALLTGHARDLDVLPNTLPPARHLGYAVQWFALAAAVLAIALVLTLRARSRHE
ncbi:SURF1 family protein [Lysobacter pythonis]|uniref:SURF1-like protein n=1 Tax=Solilutibacter pythonis TaxID=2483112 RepID=A0A3M2HTE0_9GAMM|nr:SURF1 family protein [Lysobacter pythonis]RMH89044.1 SURF1 family protein [Lysobacter pythonis]